jgi:hypothetical protein
VFANVNQADGLGGSMRVPHQNKNSEFLLLAFYDLAAGNQSPKLRAIDQFMTKHGIDVV